MSSSKAAEHICRRRMRWLMALSRCLGVASLGTRSSPWQRALHRCWRWTLLLCVWIIIIFRWRQFEAPYVTIERLLVVMEYPFNIIIVSLLILGAPCDAAFYQQWAQRLRQSEQLLYPDSEQFFTAYAYQVLKLASFTLGFHFGVMLFDLCYRDFDWLATLISNSAINLPCLMIALSLLQYGLALKFLWLMYAQLCERLRQLQCELQKGLLDAPAVIQVRPLGAKYEFAFADFVNRQTKLNSDASQLLERLRLTCATLDELHQEFIGHFGFMLLLNFCNSLMAFCEESFGMFKFFEQPDWRQWPLFIYRCLWLTMHGGRIWWILSANVGIVEQKCEICLLLSELEVYDTHDERAVNHFLLQLKAQDGRQSVAACSIIDLDTLAVGGFVSALMAIVIFLVQINLGTKSLMGSEILNGTQWSYL